MFKRLLHMRVLGVVLAGAIATSWPLGTAAAPAPWPEVSFTYIADKERLSAVLSAFGQAFGLQISMTNSVQQSSAVVDGKLTASTPSDFLNQLAASYGLTWYYNGGVLHVSRTSETLTRALPFSGASAAEMKSALTELGVLEPRFGWGSLSDRNVVLVSGPPSYVSLIERTMSALPDAPPSQQVKVFRLRHASVDDRTIQYRDKQITTVGVATILRNLISGESGKTGTTVQTVELAAPLRSTMTPVPNTAEAEVRIDAEGNGSSRSGKRGDSESATSSVNVRGVIQADSRLNAVIIKDRPDRMPIYEQLLQILDVPTQLVEIEAMILDVNTTRISELGIDWNGRIGKVAFSFGQPSAAPSATSLNVIRGENVTPSSIVADSGNFLMARINALQSDGDASIVSRPSVLTVDNMGALIDLSETFYVQTVGERVAQVTPISVGTTLKVTPHIIEHRGKLSVQLVVDIEDGAIQDLRVQNLPTVRRSTIGTQAVVSEQTSLVIGGFNSESNIKQNDGIPGIAKIPVLNVLFGKQRGSMQKRERLFLITPKVLASPAFDAVTGG